MAHLLIVAVGARSAPRIDYRFRPFRSSRSKFCWWAIDLVPEFLYKAHQLSKSTDIIVFSYGLLEPVKATRGVRIQHRRATDYEYRRYSSYDRPKTKIARTELNQTMPG